LSRNHTYRRLSWQPDVGAKGKAGGRLCLVTNDKQGTRSHPSDQPGHVYQVMAARQHGIDYAFP
jgi:hypothetical protein